MTSMKMMMYLRKKKEFKVFILKSYLSESANLKKSILTLGLVMIILLLSEK